MSKKLNRECIVCGKKYSYCENCADRALGKPWMVLYHDENCKEIYHVFSAYKGKRITKEEAKKRLDKCNLEDKNNFGSLMNEVINDIYKEEVQSSPTIVKDVTETKVTEEKEISKEETKYPHKAKYSRNRNNNIKKENNPSMKTKEGNK